MFLIILKSFVLGFLVTLPVGPIGILCLRKIFELGPIRGFILGLSQALAIFTFAIISVFSLELISESIFEYQFWLRVIGGVVLIGFGIKIFFSQNSAITNKAAVKKGFIADFFSLAALTLTSPPTWLAFLGIYAVLDLYRITTFGEHLEFTLGTLIGSVVCWLLVCLCFIGYKKKASHKMMTWINRTTGIFLVGFGIAISVTAVSLKLI
ncbi:MAG TPA: LysE family transporter [Rhabdochlamydiaceae bacterium]|jgi:threonine/homoserine/homoserine lactone efflux protein|nr:LysE family transporter [Rhabdochlamydiaceae bacterium]